MSARAASGSLSGNGAHFRLARSTSQAPSSVRGQLIRKAARTRPTEASRNARPLAPVVGLPGPALQRADRAGVERAHRARGAPALAAEHRRSLEKRRRQTQTAEAHLAVCEARRRRRRLLCRLPSTRLPPRAAVPRAPRRFSRSSASVAMAPAAARPRRPSARVHAVHVGGGRRRTRRAAGTSAPSAATPTAMPAWRNVSLTPAARPLMLVRARSPARPDRPG